MGIAGRVLLGLEQAVEVPEAVLHPRVGVHLLETHLHEYFPELRPDLRIPPSQQSRQRGGAVAPKPQPDAPRSAVVLLLATSGCQVTWQHAK